MKMRVWLCLLIFTLTACQSAKPQADVVSEGNEQVKAEEEKTQKQQAEKEKENTENKENQGLEQTNYEPIANEEKTSMQTYQDNYRNFYEIFVASFYDSDGDGKGDLKGVEEKLPYITGMGFTGIWLMPIHPSGTYHKYDVADYYAIDESYGSMEDMDSLIQASKEREVKLILDLVLNHTADDHPWFQEAVEYLKKLPKDAEPNLEECPYIDYYYFTRESGKGKAYHPIAGTDWYYEGVFWGEMPDLNVDNPKVREEFEKIIAFWLEKGIGGFRLDAVKEYHTGRTEKNVEFLSWLTQTCRKYNPEVYLVGEAWSDFHEIAEYYGSGMDSFFNFALAMHEGKIAQVVNQKNAKHTVASYAEAMTKIEETFSAKNPDYIDALFVANHDNVRMANYFKQDVDKMKLAAGLYLTMTGSSFTYYGEEIGMNSSGTKDENKRTAMVWDREIKIENPKDAEIFEQLATPMTEQEKDENSLLRYYQKALKMRQRIPEIARGKVTTYPQYGDKDMAVIKKSWKDNAVYVVYNLSDQEKEIDFSAENWQNEELLDYLSNDIADIPKWENQRLSIPARCIVVLGKMRGE